MVLHTIKYSIYDDNLNKHPTTSSSIWNHLDLWTSRASEQDSFCCWVSHWGQGMSREWLFNPVLARDLKTFGATKLNENRCLIFSRNALVRHTSWKNTMLQFFGFKQRPASLKSKQKTPFQFCHILKPHPLLQPAAANEMSTVLCFRLYFEIVSVGTSTGSKGHIRMASEITLAGFHFPNRLVEVQPCVYVCVETTVTKLLNW